MNRIHVFRMNILIALSIALSGCSSSQAQNVPANLHRDYVVAVSPYLDEQMSSEVEKFLLRFIAKTMPVGSNLVLYNGFSLKHQMSIEIPDHFGYTKLKPRLNHLKSDLPKMRSFFQSADPDPDMRYQIDVPGLMAYLAGNNTAQQTCLILFGSALYAKEPYYKMTDLFYPSDGSLFTEPEYSVYATKHLRGAFQDMDVHWIYLSEAGDNHRHKSKIDRFWYLYFHLLETQFHTYVQHLNDDLHERIIRSDLTYRPKYEVPEVKGRANMYSMDDTLSWRGFDKKTASNTPPPSLVGKPEIGLSSWNNTNCDIDLFVSPVGEEDELYYNRFSTDYGTFYKTEDPNVDNGTEMVRFSKSYKMDEIKIAINFYRNLKPQPGKTLDFDIVLVLDDKKYTKSLSFNLGLEGNLGAGGEERQPPYWITLTADELLPSSGE